jgi:cytochrome c
VQLASCSRQLGAAELGTTAPLWTKPEVPDGTAFSLDHAVDRVSQSPLPVAPPFRRLHERYPVETLQESLAEGIVTGHPSMPEFQLDPGQVGDVIAYLKSLEN